MTNEAGLIEAARNGSVAAFSDLISRYQDGLLRFLVTRTTSYADAEDALQDTLINAYRYLGSYDPRWRFSTWLYRIAINNASRQRGVATEELGELEAEEGDPLAHCIAATEHENLWSRARHLLSDEVFTALWLRYVEDMSIADIAAVLERSVSWTKVNLLRARRRLEQDMNRGRTGRRDQAYG